VKVVVVGGGAMGGTFASALARGGNDVVILDASAEVTSEITRRGLEVVEDGETVVTQLRATCSPSEVGAIDLAVIFVKAQHTQSVADDMPAYLGSETIVVSLQNGWGNADVLAKALDGERLVVGVTYHSCTTLAPGRVAHTGRGQTVVGPYEQNADLASARVVAALLASGGFEVTATAGVRTEIWKKLVLNAATLPVAAITGLRAGELADDGEVQNLVDELALEAVSVASALGLDIDRDERLERIHATLVGAGAGKPSMLQDVEGRRKTEVEVINGAIVRAGERAGIDVSLNRTMTSLVHGIERSWIR